MAPDDLSVSSPAGAWRRLPTQCAVCSQWARARLCDACVHRFAMPRPRCRRCAIEVPPGVPVCPDCLRDPPPFEAAVAAVDYAFPWVDVIGALKFGGGLDRADALAALLAGAVDAAAMPPVDGLVPVPLAPRRLAERGYNQAWELARRVARRQRARADATLLRRLIDTPHVADLPREARAAAVRGVFAVDPRRVPAIRGRRVALVDDVMTTGATASEAARTLLQAGAAAVQVWALARTPRPHAA